MHIHYINTVRYEYRRCVTAVVDSWMDDAALWPGTGVTIALPSLLSKDEQRFAAAATDDLLCELAPWLIKSRNSV